MQSGEDQIELLVLDGGSKGLRGVKGVEADERVVFEVNRAVSTLGQGFAKNLLHPCRTGGNYHHPPAVLFLLAQGLFKRIGIGFVHFIGNVFTDPGTALIQLQGSVFLRHLFHADQNLQGRLLAPQCVQRAPGKLVSINDGSGIALAIWPNQE